MDCHGEQSSRAKLIAVVATFGLLSAALGFAAEATKLQLAEVMDFLEGGCTYPSNSGPIRLGVIAIVALVAFRVYCPGNRSPSAMVQLSRYLSWVAWLVAMIFYVVGLVMIKKQGNILEYQGEPQNLYNCNVVKPGIFAAGASFALTSILLEIIYLVASTTHQPDKTTSDPPPRASILGMC
ncbi:hypothetical protein CTI12_AA507820 [Artemisia annua]|uniref:Uncharacterized protein n=1 Tax=Artemisia annua TaxID=35608 RepID=A0A2U1LC10_ARTAN|nr:hypothetical protein CTI12_AA507820 [Artemisia annua]